MNLEILATIILAAIFCLPSMVQILKANRRS